MKKNKGFTLIELLAVIVILAIIAVIAVPIVLNIINDSKESAALRSAEIYLDSVESFVATDQMNNSPNIDLSSNKIVTIKVKNLKKYGLKVKGESPNDDAEITISNKGIVSIKRFYIDNYQITMDKNSKKLLSIDINDIDHLDLSLRTIKYDIRLEEETFGIMWFTDVDADLISKLKASGVRVQLGTIITPLDYVSGNDDFTKNIGKNFVDVEYNSSKLNNDLEDDYYGIKGSIVNIKESNANKKFIGRAYITLTKNEKSTTYYAQYIDNNIENNAISIAELCYSYKQNNINEYNNLSPALREKIDYYASLFQ